MQMGKCSGKASTLSRRTAEDEDGADEATDDS